MAPSNGYRGTTRPNANGPVRPSVPPPSSVLATHIVPTNGHSHLNIDADSLLQLIDECLATDNAGHTAIGDDPVVHHTLICVIVKAGIEPLSAGQADPFSNPGRHADHITRCLQVIELAIQRSPSVLHVVSGPDHVGPTDHDVPLFLWLVPKLLSLLGSHQEALSALTSKVADLLAGIVTEAQRCKPSTRDCQLVSSFIEGCLEDLIRQLHLSDSQQSAEVIMSLSGSSEVFSRIFDQLHLHESRIEGRFPVGGVWQCIHVCCRLLRVLTAAGSVFRRMSSMVAKQTVSRLLTYFQRLWAIINETPVSMIGQATDNQSPVREFFDALTCLSELIASARENLCYVQRFCLQWTSCMLDFAGWHSNEEAQVDQTTCVYIATATVAAIQRIPLLANMIDEQLRPMRWEDINASEIDPKMLQQRSQAILADLLDRIRSPNHSDAVPQLAWPDSDRPRKRPRLSTEDAAPRKDAPSRKPLLYLNRLLTGEDTSQVTGLSKIAAGYFRRLAEESQCSVLIQLGLVACSECTEIIIEDEASQTFVCGNCDMEVTPSSENFLSGDTEEELFKTLIVIVPMTQRSAKVRVAAILAMGRLLTHSNNTDNLKLASSSLGEWCLQSLQSSVRDIRMAACSVLQTFVRSRPQLTYDVTRQNRVVALEFLQSLWDRKDTALQETVVLALTSLAKVSGDEELNIVLIRLVEHLGHTNPYISALVYGELQKLANVLKLPPTALLRPFWRTIGVVVIKNFQSRPVIAQQLCDFLGLQMDGLLLLIEGAALPYLVQTGKLSLINRIASTHGSKMSSYDLCIERRNLASILSYLLMQSTTDPEETIMNLLTDVSPDFKEMDLAGWVKLNPDYIACELLKSIIDAEDAHSSRAHQALYLLAQLDQRRPGQSSASRKSDIMGNFLEANVLGIVTEYTNVLEGVETVQPHAEKRRCLAAIGELVKLGKSRILVALPQVCACLRSAMENSEVCNRAFVSWALMVSTLKEADVASLVDQTLAIIVRYWDTLHSDTQQLAYNVVSDILKKHTSLVRDIYSTMPSLSSIPLMSKFEAELNSLKRQLDDRHGMIAFIQRLSNENLAVVERALTELVALLAQKQDFLYDSILRDQPDPFVADLTRAILDCCVRYGNDSSVTTLCAKCLGRIGCLDPNKIESSREKTILVVLSNFAKAEETVDFILNFLERVVVKAFLSATSTRSQTFLAWAMQELLRLCNLDDSASLRSRATGTSATHRRWLDLPEAVRSTLTPFLTSRYNVSIIPAPQIQCTHPIFSTNSSHSQWLRTWVSDLLERATVDNAKLIFGICARLIKGQDVSVPMFLLPFVALNVIIGGVEKDKVELVDEMLVVLRQPMTGSHQIDENIRLCSESVFDILDHMSKWVQLRKRQYAAAVARADRGVPESNLEIAGAQLKTVENVLSSVPPDLISRRAIDCNSYARALYHWEQYVRQVRDDYEDPDDLLERLQEIYSQIDEPDGIEGISAQLHVLNIDQQMLEHRKAGRWTAAQSWYELQIEQEPENADTQINLLTCLRESGQHDTLINRFDALDTDSSFRKVVPFVIEASWVLSRWNKLDEYVEQSGGTKGDFTIGIANHLQALRDENIERTQDLSNDLYQTTVGGLTTTSVLSFQACHDILLRLHAVTEVRDISNAKHDDLVATLNNLDRRLDVLGVYVSEKQYLLGLRRAVMELSPAFGDRHIAASWLTTARLARKAGSTNQAYSAILHASALGDHSATIEQAKLMWQDGHHRKAIQTLEGAIDAGVFKADGYLAEDEPVTLTTNQQQQQNIVTAKAYLLLGKWLDAAGQTQSEVIIKTYRKVTENNRKSEKGYYYLGRHYAKILDSERVKTPGKESQVYLTGETTKLVIESYLRSLIVGSKYIFQTLPKVLTLWLELVAGVEQPQDARRGNEKFQTSIAQQRRRVVEETNSQVKKYVESKMQAVVLYTIFPQIVARICHPNQAVYGILVSMVVKVVKAFPQQALWPVLAMVKSQAKDRASRGLSIIAKVVEVQKKSGKDTAAAELRNMITQGQKFSDELLRVSEYPIEGKASRVSLSRDLGFNHKIAPSRLVVPIESCLMPTLPTNYEPATLKSSRAFSKDAITITAFLDEALVLSSLQKPRKLSIRGSDGKVYGLLAKPKDDMRKDQRLMEFNTMINRFLKRDVEASKRRLYIRTYAVVPLNEECGLIEWVDNLKTFRDIILKLYKDRNITPNYLEIRNMLDEACSGGPEKYRVFQDKILANFPPVFHDWFVDTFPDPSAWFNARLRYTRSCAVMSIVGHVLGLGDRHGENILFEEDNGGTLHVDFNCLFDKGLTFEKPECVPFRLTHNMVDAFGAYGYNGPFRRCSEITLSLLRGNEDALMTILETFLHDPTTDFINNAGKGKRKGASGVPDTPMGVLDGVRGKVRGMLAGESVPLSVGGYVEEMIKRATDQGNLAKMYIGWCAFF